MGLAAPLLVQLRPSLRMPSAVAEIVLGIIVGQALLGWARVDEPVLVLSDLGLAALLFLAGLEIDVRQLRGGFGRLAGAYAASVGIATAVAFAVSAVEPITHPLLVAFALASSTMGLVVPILHDADATRSALGQAVLAGASFGELGAIVLVSLFFSGHSSSTGSELFLLLVFGLVAVVVALLLSGISHAGGVQRTLERLERTSAQLGVRVSVAIVGGFAALASALGLESILAVFAAGMILRAVDHDERLVHPEFRVKVEAIGYGFLVPVFFVASGMELRFAALFHRPLHLVLVPLFALGLLLARGLPALAFRRQLGLRATAALGLLQSASLPVIVIVAQLGHELRVFDDPTQAALVLAGLVSVILFPPGALAVLREDPGAVGGELTVPGPAAPRSIAAERRPAREGR